MAGHAGKLTVSLAEAVVVTAVSVDHIAPGNAPRRPGGAAQRGTDDAAAARATAPRRMALYGLSDAAAGAASTLLGRFEYDAGGAVTQTFVLPPHGTFRHVQLVVESNHGNPALTCLYRLRVHGVPAPAG